MKARTPPVAAIGREVFAHVRRERRALRHGLGALAVLLSVTLVAGVVLGQIEGLLERLPGLLVLMPAAIGMRGAVFGALGARLGTGMLTGQFEMSLKAGSFLRANAEAAVLLTVVTAALLGLLARASAAAFGLPSISVWALVTVSMLGAILSSGIVLGAVVLLARTAEARNWDMDAIGTPIISATADISTLPAVAVAALALGNTVLETVAGVVFGLTAAGAAVYAVRHPDAGARRIVRESLPVLLYAAGMGTLAGTVLSARLETLVTSPALLVAIPPFIATCGALGGILSARLASALHLGLLEARPVPQQGALLDGALVAVLAVVAFAAVGILTEVAAVLTGLASPGTAQLVSATLLGGLLASAVVFFVAYYAASTSYRFGLDPDNYGVPVVTASMDFLGILCLVAAIALVGVG